MKKIVGAAAAVVLLNGCASITDGTSQSIIISMDPKEARCVASREGVELGTVTRSQQTLTVGKGARDIILLCKAQGHEDKTLRLVSKTQAAGVVGGIFLDLGIVDMMTGAMWKYPESVNVVLDPAAATVPAAPAPVASAPAATVAVQDGAATKP